MRSAGKILDRLKGERNKADYALTNPVYNQRATAKDVVAYVFQILTAIAGCLADGLRRTQAEVELKAWAQTRTGVLLGFSVI